MKVAYETLKGNTDVKMRLKVSMQLRPGFILAINKWDLLFMQPPRDWVIIKRGRTIQARRLPVLKRRRIQGGFPKFGAGKKSPVGFLELKRAVTPCGLTGLHKKTLLPAIPYRWWSVGAVGPRGALAFLFCGPCKGGAASKKESVLSCGGC